MRDRINTMRHLFVETLHEKGVTQDFSFIANQRGMFSFSGLTPDQVSREILGALRTQGPAQPSAEALAEMPARDKKRYSIHRAIRLQAELLYTQEQYDIVLI